MKISIQNISVDPVTVAYAQEGAGAISVNPMSTMETEYGGRVFTIRNNSDMIMEYILYNGNFVVDDNGLRANNEALYYVVWKREQTVVENLSSSEENVSGEELEGQSSSSEPIQMETDDSEESRNSISNVMASVLYDGSFVIDARGIKPELQPSEYISRWTDSSSEIVG